ncbi:unnamed protein product [Kuraishia capsulata CBS 1993]|uniref:Pre-mRNA-splicing factor 3 domain-containing protein n=1 Tax=Kuraishia capsulata CBS 1993 TaxID=1382522 RepID=W6MK47_9ASCO|nr:uncharacterized protein KUCA_T00000929001 [Kuraishia capsulata CBS 1993]CDK24962.1 unnamed protein product [Kuraishia capsulata CBS 1993]
MSEKRLYDGGHPRGKRRRPNHDSNSTRRAVDASANSSTTTTLTRSISPSTSDDERKDRGGLNVEIHPLLRSNAPAPVMPKSFNPVQRTKVREGFLPSQLNPYLNQADMAPARHHRSLAFNAPGKYIHKAEELREKIREEKELKELELRKKDQGLAPDETIGEQYYRVQDPPATEWWDRPYLKERNYDHLDDPEKLTYTDLTSDDCPITVYIQHPVPVQAPWEKHIPPPKPLFLTKIELKRIRRNERSLKHQEKQDRIRLGLDPAPAPKVKLKNLMNVLTNDAIKNPTAVEMRVKAEVAERKRVHEQTNEERKLTPEQRHEKQTLKNIADLQSGVVSCVYKIDRLVNPKHYYKVDINAKQLELNGMVICLKDSFSLVVTEGGKKAVNQYKKLMTRRINWTENEAAKPRAPKDDSQQSPVHDDTQVLEDLSDNNCQIVWEGELANLHFHKWTVQNVEDHESALALLGRYHLDNYWRQATALN